MRKHRRSQISVKYCLLGHNEHVLMQDTVLYHLMEMHFADNLKRSKTRVSLMFCPMSVSDNLNIK